MNVLVLGATGFIGGQIAIQALASGWHVKALRRNPGTAGVLPNHPVEWVDGLLTDQSALESALKDVDVVFHAAAYYPTRIDRRAEKEKLEYACMEIDTIIRAIERSSITKFIYTSSLSTIGFPPLGSKRLADENDYYRSGDIKKSTYYEAKLIMESRLLAAAKVGLPVIILNPTAVYGPGDFHLTTGKLFIAVVKGRVFAWIPGVINIIDVRDVADAHIRAVELGVIGERYILGGHNLNIKDALSLVADIAGQPRPAFEIPGWALNLTLAIDGLLPMVNLTGNHLRAVLRWQGFDNSKSRKILGLSPRPIATTIHDSLTWFLENNYI